MLGRGWLALRQAQEALAGGRLDDAQRLLSLSVAQGQRGAAALLGSLAQRLADRGRDHLLRDDPDAAWSDLLLAEAVQAGAPGTDSLRQALTQRGVDQVLTLVRAGEPARASEALARLKTNDARSPQLAGLRQTVSDWLAAREQADRGECGPALETIERLRRLHPEIAPLDRFGVELEQRGAALTGLLSRLHEAAAASRWTEVVQVAEQVLTVAPQHAEARRVRSRAWKAGEPVTVAMRGPSAEPSRSAPVADGPPLRLLLWIDGVGGYLVCLGSRLTFGQATAGDRVDVPLVADVSRLHASLSRDGEGYVLEAVRPVQVNGKIATRALLRPGDRVTLGASCQFVFRLPVPVSGTARLDLVSGHRVPLGVDGVLLMADSLVLGDEGQAHVAVPDLEKPLVFFRHKDGLGLRHRGGVTVNGQPAPERGPLPLPALVTVGEVSFAVESVV